MRLFVHLEQETSPIAPGLRVSTTEIVIYGAGGFAREVVWLAQSCGSDEGGPFQVVSFVDDDQSLHGREVNGIRVRSLQDARREFPQARMVLGIGRPKPRQLVMRRARDAGFDFQSLIHPRVERSEWVRMGPGAIICAGSILTTNIEIGEQVQINLDCTIGHDVVLRDFATLAPGVHVSGWVTLEEGVYVGTGATIINGVEGSPLVIGKDAVVGAGACVTRAVPPATTVVGIPAKALNR
jgi:sugar O-acyltransferase (sialic acid O-acetyltransferase NeuD family)